MDETVGAPDPAGSDGGAAVNPADGGRAVTTAGGDGAADPAGGGEAVGSAEELLVACGAGEIDHPGGTLLAHLRRVAARLADWGARPELATAGLCHACYGTDGFAVALLPLTERDRLAAAVGPATEALVYRYASCDRSFSYPGLAAADGPFRDRFTGAEFVPDLAARRDFAELTAANELDLVAVNPEFRATAGPAIGRLLTRFGPLLSEPARAQRRALLG